MLEEEWHIHRQYDQFQVMQQPRQRQRQRQQDSYGETESRH